MLDNVFKGHYVLIVTTPPPPQLLTNPRLSIYEKPLFSVISSNHKAAGAAKQELFFYSVFFFDSRPPFCSFIELVQGQRSESPNLRWRRPSMGMWHLTCHCVSLHTCVSVCLEVKDWLRHFGPLVGSHFNFMGTEQHCVNFMGRRWRPPQARRDPGLVPEGHQRSGSPWQSA